MSRGRTSLRQKNTNRIDPLNTIHRIVGICLLMDRIPDFDTPQKFVSNPVSSPDRSVKDYPS